MPLPAPQTWTDGEEPENYPSAADLNLDWRDSFDFLLGYSRPMVLLHSTTSVTIANPGPTAMILDSEILKRGGMVHDNVTNNTRVEVPYDGMYAGYMFVGHNSVSTLVSRYTAILRKNGSTQIARAGGTGPAITSDNQFHASFAVELEANDYVEFLVAGAGTTTTSSAASGLNRMKFAMWYEGDAA